MSNDEIVWLVVLADYIVGAVSVVGALMNLGSKGGEA